MTHRITISLKTFKNIILNFLPAFRIFIFQISALLVITGSAGAYVHENLTFSWHANPPEDNIVSYRLYYGSASRFDSSGNLKFNFSYDYYIDVADSLLCDNRNTSLGCRYLDEDELSCENIYGDSPKCTVSNLEDTLFFALTACSLSQESNFTQEIMARPSTVLSSLNVVPLIQGLLLKN